MSHNLISLFSILGTIWLTMLQRLVSYPLNTAAGGVDHSK